MRQAKGCIETLNGQAGGVFGGGGHEQK
jgi:hypothetical protein